MNLPRSIELIEKLGSGGFGEVWRARYSNGYDTDRDVAIKLLKSVDSESRTRFAREIKLLQEHIDNRFIVDIIGYNLNQDPPYIIMEYCTHGSLKGWVVQQRSWRDIMTAIAHVVQGLQGIHDHLGFHRDIKPENLLLTMTDGGLRVKVADFGLARQPDLHASMTNHPCGTLQYMAPEVLRGFVDSTFAVPYTSAADIYSLGITAVELLTGKRDIAALNHLDCPPNVVNLVRAMVDSNPINRPGIQKIAAQLRAMLEGPSPPVEYKMPSEAQPVQIPAQKQGPGVGEALLAGGLVMGGLFALLKLLEGGGKEWDSSVGRYRGSDGRFRS